MGMKHVGVGHQKNCWYCGQTGCLRHFITEDEWELGGKMVDILAEKFQEE
jgi:predicted NBD/HSP70 family sugar kinase